MTEPHQPVPDDLADLLSAYVDGELTDDERVMVDAVLETDPAAQQWLHGLQDTALLVRELPEVEPRRPIQEVTRRPAAAGRSRRGIRSIRSGMAAVVGAAAVWLLILSFTGAETIPGIPDIEALSTRHAQAMEPGTTSEFMVMEADEIAMASLAPESIDGMAREGIYQRGNLVHVVFYDGSHAISVFHEPGEVDWGGLPGGGEMMDMDEVGSKAWHTTMDDQDVVITEMSGQMVTIVADGDIGTDMVFKIPKLLHA